MLGLKVPGLVKGLGLEFFRCIIGRHGMVIEIGVTSWGWCRVPCSRPSENFENNSDRWGSCIPGYGVWRYMR